MTYLSCLTDEDRLLVLDASVVINLLATGYAREILAALDRLVVLPEPVVREVENGEQRGHGAKIKCRDLLIRGHIEIADLDGASLDIFMGLVGGTTSSSLGDGEAATIAIASTRQGCAVIDEKKASKLLAGSFEHIRAATTIDLLSYGAIISQLGQPALAAGMNAALNDGRMQVREIQFDWVQDVIGKAATANCSGLRRFVRSRKLDSP
jgi:predicted nucleic acid-binding protein